MKRARATLASTATAVLLIAGCGDTDDLGPGSEPDPATQEEQDPGTEEAAPTDESAAGESATEEEAAEEEAPDELEVDDESAVEEGQHLVEFDEPIVYESNGVRLSITGVGFTSLDSPVVDQEVRDFLEEDTRTILALEMTVSNDSGEAINIWANQGTVQVGREQIDADLWLSDDFAGEMRDGVDDDGLVVWQLETEFDEAVALGELVYTTMAPSSMETYEPVADDVELTVTW